MPEMAPEAAEFTNATFARIFYEIAAMVELKGESPFKSRAYRTAADTFANLGEDVKQVWREGRLDDLPGVGKAISEKVDELMRTGKLRFYDRLTAEIPPALIAITEIPHVGAKTAMLLYKTLGIQGIADLEKALDDGRILQVPGIGQKSVETIRQGIATIQRRSADKRELLGTALPIMRQMLVLLKDKCPGNIDRIEVAGSARRWRPTVGDLDILATAKDPIQVIDCFVKLPMVGSVESQGENKATVRLHNGLQVDLYVLPPEHYISLLNHFTSARPHNIKLRDRAIRMGYHLNEYGLTKNGQPVPISSEADIYSALGLQYIPPEMREDRGEIEAAERHALPTLVEMEDIKGDLHCHTTWSDGTLSVYDMARAAKARGYQYVAITDHSQSLTVANGLTVERLRAQRKEVEEARARLGPDFRIFHGIELEIKLDGTLDFSDDVLAWLDIVVASIHSGLRQPGEQVTQRALNAVRNPHVDILGHPTGRIINQREPSAMDVGAVIKEAARTGTALEINSAPDRLDLDDIYIKEAMEEGCTLSIDTDAHSRGNYDLLEYGVHLARRGWATPDRVLTCWDGDKVEAWLKARG
ncbi:MAG TPA: DNA polymerase/3'-5' exonuclease PolX [Chloroflexia bacterium]|nr:DNA polymerase/3'-5' exonuclease PolX [Chloroflexia bacterium]